VPCHITLGCVFAAMKVRAGRERPSQTLDGTRARACSLARAERRAVSRRWTLLTGLVAAALCGCWLLEGGPPGGGPMGPGSDPDTGEVCIPVSSDGQYAMGLHVLHNPDRHDAVITGLSLVEPRGLTMAGAVVLTIDKTAIGVRPSWPPQGEAKTPAWRSAVPAERARIPAGSAFRKNLVLHLSGKPTAPASLKALKVAYRIGDKRFEMQTTYALQIKAKCF
jgi:hypothetical protein